MELKGKKEEKKKADSIACGGIGVADEKNILLDWLKIGILGIILFLFVRAFLFSSYEVDGNSMETTLANGDKLIVNKVGYEFGSISRFDILVFHAENENDYVKRVIGLPGEKIEYRNDQLYVNGKAIEEPFLDNGSGILGQKGTEDFTLSQYTGVERVPDGQLFVMGDNRLNSLDSRHFGYVPVKNVIGKVNVRYWPVEKFYIEL